MHNTWRGLLLVGGVALLLSACGDDDGAAGSAGEAGSGGTAGDAGTGGTAGDAGSGGGGARPHPLYPALDLDTLPGDGGAESGPYEAPMLPNTTREVTVSTTGSQAAADVLEACQTAGTAVTLSAGAGQLGTLDFGNVEDCDVTLAADAVATMVYIGHLPGPQIAPAHRIRIRGGQIGSIMVDPGSSDIVFDGVIVNNGVVPVEQRPGVAIYLMDNDEGFVNRFAFINSIMRLVATTADDAGNTDGCGYLAAGAHNVFFANNNVVTAGNRNSWGFRIGGGENFIVVDSAVRVSFHKLIRMNDGPVDYVVVRGGVWMRENTQTAGGESLNDAWAQLGDLGTDNIFIHDTAIHLLNPDPLNFGAWNGPGQVGKSWEMRRIAWHARSENVISDAILTARGNDCVDGAICDYGAGTHTFEYSDNVMFPENPWRALPAIDIDNPDDQPVM